MVQESKVSREKKEKMLKLFEDANIDPITTLMDTMFQKILIRRSCWKLP